MNDAFIRQAFADRRLALLHCPKHYDKTGYY
jgi:hypothetical protein